MKLFSTLKKIYKRNLIVISSVIFLLFFGLIILAWAALTDRINLFATSNEVQNQASFSYRDADGNVQPTIYSNFITTQISQLAPTAPSSLSATAVSSSQINLAWQDNSTNEDGFKIERSLAATNGFVQIATVGINITTYSNSGLAPSTTYYYRVRTYNTAGDSLYSNTDSATTQVSIPNAPSNLSATVVSSSQINLAWQDNSTNEQGFKIDRSTSAVGPFSQIATVNANITTYQNTGLSASTTYYYRLKAYNAAGDSANSNTASATTQSSITVPTAPSSLSAAAISSSQINLTWQDNSNNEDGFKIERSVSPVSGFSQIATIAANVTTFQNTGLSSSTTYYYRVRAYNSAGDSAYSNTANATTFQSIPTAPSNLVAAAISNSQINLAWQDNSNNETGFKIERSLSAASGFSQITTVGANVTAYQNIGLATGTTYYYRVRAYNGTGDSSYSNIANAITFTSAIPAAPSNFQATGKVGFIEITWQDNSTNETNFDLWRKPDGSTWIKIAQPTTNTVSYNDHDIESGVLYWYIIRAQNSFGSSTWSNSDSAMSSSDTQPPTAPTNLTATAVSSSQINLSWTASTDNVGVVGYYIYRNSMKVGSTASTSYSDTGLTLSTTYSYQVSAFDAAANESGKSNTASATTQALTDNPPTVSITNPPDGATVSGTVNMTATASDDKGVTKVDFYIDGVFKASDTTTPYSWSWDTTGYSNGNHTIMARVYDTAGQYSNDTHTVTVNNQQLEVTISNVSVSATAHSATIRWTTNVPATSQVQYGTSSAYGQSTPLDTNLVTNHSVTINGLLRRTRYYYKIISTAGDSTVTYTNTFRTKNR